MDIALNKVVSIFYIVIYGDYRWNIDINKIKSENT